MTSMLTPPKPALLALADGTIYRGSAFGAAAVAAGEVCFNTSLTGYQEIITDPSYAGQIVTMTYTQIGNVGTTPEDDEADRPFLRAFVVKEHFEAPSNWRSREPLGAFLARHGVPGIAGIDTRALVRRIRDHGFQMCVVSTDPAPQDAAALVAQARSAPGLRRLVVYDFGVKRNILRHLVEQGFDVTVVPARTPASEALALEPDAIFLSNGPGDPAAVEGVPEIVRELAERKPLFGICLGHQILGRALGGTTRKLKFGHHGGNQPGQDRATGKVAICAENHGYAVDADSLRVAGEAVEITHVNLNDGCVEGLAHAERPLFSVQYHPEASPGPHDASYFFGRFRRMVDLHVAGESVTGASIARGA